MQDKFNEFLVNNNFLPLENGDWKMTLVDHTNEKYPFEYKKKLDTELQGQTNGVYVYTNLQGDVYYVGQGKLKSRIKKKYAQAIRVYPIENLKTIPSSRYFFFRSHKEVMKVYTRNIQGIQEQIAIEAMLTTVLKPKYLNFLQEFNRIKKDGNLLTFLTELMSKKPV